MIATIDVVTYHMREKATQMTKNQALAEIDASNVRAGQRWRHFKGGEYDVVAVALLEASMDPAVVYAGHDGVVWIRALHVFLEEASPGVPRFSRIDSEEYCTVGAGVTSRVYTREQAQQEVRKTCNACALSEGNCKAADCLTHGPLFPYSTQPEPSHPMAPRKKGGRFL